MPKVTGSNPDYSNYFNLICVGMQVWSKQAVCKTDPSGSVVQIYSGAPINASVLQVWSKRAVCKTDPKGAVVQIHPDAPNKKKGKKKYERTIYRRYISIYQWLVS